jgi:hypothetical protein
MGMLERRVVVGALALALVLPMAPLAAAQGASDGAPRKRLPTRVRVYPDYPGPNAKRDCVVHYEQQNRPSGPVIYPRMQCWWTQG